MHAADSSGRFDAGRGAKKSRSCAEKFRTVHTCAPNLDSVEHEGGGWFPTLEWAGVRGGLGRRRRGRLVQSRALDLADLVGLDEVAFLDVVVALEVDAAFEALGHLANV